MSIATSFQRLRLLHVALAIGIFVGATAPALAIDHTYYLDLDQDSYGDPNNTMTVPTNWLPNRLLTQRAGDPDDTTQAIYGVPVDKGQRRFGLELGDSADSGAWNGPLLDELAADAVTWETRWNQLESAPGEYAGPDAAVLSAVGPNLPGTGLALNLTVSAISGTDLTLPADLLEAINAGTLRMNDAAVVDRYKALLDRVHTELGGATLVSLQIGHEVDLMFSVRPDLNFWLDFQVFYYVVSQHAKSLWGSTLNIGLTATHLGLSEPLQRWLLAYLNSTSDIISLTYFPHNADFTVPDPTTLDIGGMFQSILDTNDSKPIYVQATAYPTLEDALGTQMKQSQFMYAFFEAWDQHAALIPFVSFFRLHDPDIAAVQRIILSNGLDAQNSALISNLFSLGLRERAGDGKHKPAYDSLRNLAFERGWWREPVRTTRQYLMGFTPELYDFPSDPAETALVEDYIIEKLETLGDIVNLHMDSGIPWPEAFADDFSSANAPYSDQLIATWHTLRNRVPPPNKLLVSINPLGIPRRKLAPYWGYGEHFQYQQGPPWDRIPTGDFSDGAPRIPPAPWDSYGLGDEPVKTAFLNYARRTVEFFNPDYLMIGIEVSATQVEEEAAWQDFVSLHRHVYVELKSLYPDLPVILSFSATSYMTDEFYPLAYAFDPDMEQGHTWKYDEMEPGVRERLKQGLRDVLDYTDIIALSVYPHFGKYNAYQMPASMWTPLFDLLHEIGADDKPIAVSESGYSADPFSIVISEAFDPYVFTGSPEKQDRYLKLMLYELNKAPNPVEFVINYQVRDGDLWWQRLFSSGEDIFNQFYQYFRDIGILAGDGSDRPATNRWRDEFALPHVPAITP